MAGNGVGLAEAISALRAELLKALDAGDGVPLRFRLAPVELSLQVAVTKEGNGKIGWHILEAGGSYTSVTTQTLRLRLEPVWLTGDGSYTGDFVVADQTAQEPLFGPRG
jgi:hypothetical protein